MYVKTNQLVTETLFTEPTPYGKIVDSTLLTRPEQTYRKDYIDYSLTSTPVSVGVGLLTSGLSTLTGSATGNLSVAISRNNSTQAYVSAAADILSKMKDLATTAAASTTTDTGRADLDTQAAELMTKLNSIYTEASFNGESIMRGGTTFVMGSLDGQSFEMHNGNASSTYLGINNLRLNTQANAQTALTNLETAISNMAGQQSLALNEGQGLQNTYNALSLSLAGSQANAGVGVSQDYALTAFENSMAVLSHEMVYALGVQGKNLREDTTKTIQSALKNISDSIKSAAEQAQKQQAAAEQAAEKQKAAAEQAQKAPPELPQAKAPETPEVKTQPPPTQEAPAPAVPQIQQQAAENTAPTTGKTPAWTAPEGNSSSTSNT